MDPQLQKLLSENLELAKENNELLHKLIRAQKAAMIYRVVYWAIIILSTVGALFFIKPMLSSLVGVYTGGASDGSNVSDVFKNLSDKKQIQDFVNSMK